MSEKTTQSSSGVSFCGLLAIVFITLKLIGKISWSWWWVTCPIWGPICIAVGILLMVLIFKFLSE